MSRISTIWIAAILLSAGASMSPGRLACQAPSITPQDPSTLDEFFRVDRATGAPTPLEHAKLKSVTFGQEMEFYIEGSASVAFKAGEPQQFVIRLMSLGESSGTDTLTAEVRRRIVLGPLLVQQFGRKHVVGRFATRTEIPFDIVPFGQSTLGLDPKKPARAAQSLLMTPHVPLAPGKYQIWLKGVGIFQNIPVRGEHWAFDIVAR